MPTANPQVTVASRTGYYGASPLALAALFGSSVGAANGGTGRAYTILSKLPLNAGGLMTWTSASFPIVVSSAECGAAWVRLLRVTAGGNIVGGTEEIVACSANLIVTPLAESGLATAAICLTFAAAAGYDYWVEVAGLQTGGANGYVLPTRNTAAINVSLGFAKVRLYTGVTATTWPTTLPSTSAAVTDGYAAVFAITWMQTTDRICWRIPGISNIGSSVRLYYFPFFTDGDRTFLGGAGLSPDGAANTISLLFDSMAGDGALATIGGFGLDFADGAKALIYRGAASTPATLGADAGTDAYDVLAVIDGVNEDDQQPMDVWLTNTEGQGLGALAAGERLPVSVAKAALGASMAGYVDGEELHHILAISGSSNADFGDLYIAARAMAIISDSNGALLIAVGTTEYLLVDAATNGRRMTESVAGLHNSIYAAYADPAGTYARVAEIPGAVIVIWASLNDMCWITGDDSETYRKLEFVGRIGRMIGDAAGRAAATGWNPIVVIGPLLPNPADVTWTARQIAATREVDAALARIGNLGRVIYVSIMNGYVPAAEGGLHLSGAQAIALMAEINAAIELGLAPPAKPAAGWMLQPRKPMNLEIRKALIGDGTDQPVTVNRGQTLVVHGIGGTVEVREAVAAARKFTIAADSPTALGESLGQTLFLRANAGVTIDLATI